MRIVSWNVYYPNKKIVSTFNNILSTQPDVICFQEFPYQMLHLFDKNDYIINFTYDAKDITGDSGMLILTATRKQYPIESVKVYTYFTKKVSSLLNNLGYNLFTKRQEIHEALIVEVNGIKIVNSRLSAATGPLNKTRMLKNILEFIGSKSSVICGDLNTSSHLGFKLLTGPFRGYSLHEYLFDESKKINDLIKDYGYSNPFFGQKTLTYKLAPAMQLDYILPSGDLRVTNLLTHKKNTGSDHCILQLDIADNHT